MHTRTIGLVALAAACVMGLAAGAAWARNGQLENWEEPMETHWSALEFRDSSATVRCNVTLDGEFERASFTKTGGLKLGTINEAEAKECSGGRLTVSRETLPWEIDYSSFTGTLPAIAGISVNLIGVAARIAPTGQPECQFRTEARHPARATGSVTRETGTIPSVRSDESARIPLTGEALCSLAGELVLVGTGRDEPEAETPVERVRLI